MRKRKEKLGLTDDTVREIQTVSVLLKRINEEYVKRQAEVEVQDRANAELLATATKEERELIEEIGKAKKTVEKMTADYSKIEKDVEAVEKKKAEKDVVREADVRAGKVSLTEFRTKGKSDAKIEGEALTRSVSELETTLDVVRGKNLEILKLGERLGDCRNTIRNLTIRPGVIMRDMLKGLYEFSDAQVNEFMTELDSLRTEWDQVKQDLLLTQGKSMSGRHTWEQLTMKQARDLQFDPILPLSCAGQLKRELAKYEGSDGISLTLYLNEKIVEVTNLKPGRIPQIINLKEVPGAGFTREKAGK